MAATNEVVIPQGLSPPSPADDLLNAVAARFRELEAAIETYREQLEAANRRLAAYAEFEGGLHEAMSSALLRVNDDMAERLVALRAEFPQLSVDRDALLDEVARLRQERDALEEKVAALQPAVSSLRETATEVFRAILQDVLADLGPEMADRVAFPANELPRYPGSTESLLAPIVEPEARATARIAELEPRASAPVAELALVLRPVRSFPQLLAIEHRIQDVPGVLSLYAQDLADQVALVAVHLEAETTVEAFAAALERLDRPRLRVERSGARSVEARIVDESATG